MNYSMSETRLPVDLVYSLVIQQLKTGCGNPMCGNRYCTSGSSSVPLELLDYSGKVDENKVLKLVSKGGDVDNLLCQLPLKVILARVQTVDKKFDPKLQMFLPHFWALGTPSFSSIIEAEAPLTCPFPNERLFKFYMIDAPTRSFSRLNDFIGIGVTSVLDEYFCFIQWLSLVKERGFLSLLYGYLIALIDRLSVYPRYSQAILQEETAAVTPVAFMLLLNEENLDINKYPYKYSSGERKFGLLLDSSQHYQQQSGDESQSIVLLHLALERLVGDSTDEFKLNLLHFFDTIIPLLRKNYPIGESLSDIMGPAPLIPIYNIRGTSSSPKEMEISRSSRDTSFKFVHKDLDLSSLGSDAPFICPKHLNHKLKTVVKRIGKILKNVADNYREDLPIRKIHLDEDTQYEIECGLKILDMLWFINLKFHFAKTKKFIIPEVNDNKLYNLINDFDVFIAVSKSAEDRTKGLSVRGENYSFAKMLDIPNFMTSPLCLRVRFYINIGVTERCTAFSFLFHPYILNTSIKSRILATELRLNRTADIPVIPQFIPGFSLPITGIEYERIIPIVVSRDNLVHDTISILSKIPPKDLSRSQLKVKFKGEEGVDEGGVSMEYFNLVIDKLVNPKYGHFIPVGSSHDNTGLENEIGEEFIPSVDSAEVNDVNMSESGGIYMSEKEGKNDKSYDSAAAVGREGGEEMITTGISERQFPTIYERRNRMPLWFDKLSDLYNFKHSCVISDGATIPIPPYLVPETCGQLQATQSTEELMYFTGMLFGLAVNNSIVMDVELPKVFYRKLASINMGGTSGTSMPKWMLNESLFTLSDVASINDQLASSLSSLLDLAFDKNTTDNDIDALELYQSADTEHHGEIVSIPLLPVQISKYDSPSTIREAIPKVTRTTATDFVKAYVKHECSDGVRSMFTPFKKGFKDVLGCAAFCLLAPTDIKHCLVGAQVNEDTINELEEGCSYEGFGGGDVWVKWFWEITKAWNIKNVKKLLKFVTGSARVGVMGAKGLGFKIIANGEGDNMLPTSHVCFNVLMLPKYSSKKIMEEKLLTAIQNSEGFGLR